MGGLRFPTVVRIALAVFVLLWLLGPDSLRSTFPAWFVFAVAAALELHFFLGARRAQPRLPNRLPQDADRERWGPAPEPEHDPDAAAGEEADEDVDADEEWVDEEEEWEPEPEPYRRRLPGRGALALVLVVAGLLVGAWLWESRTGWNGLSSETRAQVAARLSAEAGVIAGKDVDVRCDERGEYVGAVQHADGIAVVGGTLSYLTPQRCYDLYRLAFRGEDDGSQTARALAVLAHEAWHLRGVRNEGATECYALQSAVALGERMGLESGRARQLMRQQLTENALRARGSSQYLVPAECRDGGRLDLAPDDSRFP